MGEVYRAKDSKLKREVAIKILPDAFSRDAERVARFQREAEVLASLNNPHIAVKLSRRRTGHKRPVMRRRAPYGVARGSHCFRPWRSSLGLPLRRLCCFSVQRRHYWKPSPDLLQQRRMGSPFIVFRFLSKIGSAKAQ